MPVGIQTIIDSITQGRIGMLRWECSILASGFDSEFFALDMEKLFEPSQRGVLQDH